MRVRRLQIEQQMAKIAIESTMASLKIDIPKREMIIQSRKAEMTLDREEGKIELDLSVQKANLGLMGVRDLTSARIAEAKSKLEQSRLEYSADGDAIATLPSRGNAIAAVAKKNMLKTRPPEMNSGRVPQPAVRVEGKPGKLDINWTKSDLVIKWGKYEPPVITVEPKASVEIELIQEPVVECRVVEMEIPPETGRMIDAKA